ncbi:MULTISPECIES: hypothetical protein [Pseudomonas]|uniref:hypothetical protein n=1 Tax=Pseudomonas TaxID=286 RepID=UPI000D866138|nr:MULTISPECIES: hypothetical protein [Pseudomonas]EKV3204535.1 hypothetical protein [Pseudomonas aeruginosa]MBH4412242.1 hypothetical protein [Pseudomonas aeruginosa]PYB99974.1 hypothetical protein DMX12_14290 [Pseudomonas sp. MB-090624]
MRSEDINNEIFLEEFIKYKHELTSKSIKEGIGRELTQKELNFDNALELSMLYKNEFSKTNVEEIKEFIKENLVEISNNKFKAIAHKILGIRLEVDIDINDLSDKVLNNYDKLTDLSIRFLEEMGCNCGRGIKLNSERLKDLGGELMCDYMLHTKQGFNVEQLMNKHIYHILIELGDNYSNMDANFKDMDDLRFEDGKVILPKKAMLTQPGKQVDISDGYGGGYELTALLKDKKFVAELEQRFKNYTNSNVMRLKREFDMELGKEPSKKPVIKKLTDL